jgi:Protein of unknown function (DUF2934)
MDQNIEDLIRDRAYAIWEAHGRHDGHDLEHWAQAEGGENSAATPEDKDVDPLAASAAPPTAPV